MACAPPDRTILSVAALINTSFDQYVTTSAEKAYDDLCDWKDHARWVPFTRITLHSNQEFTAHTGIGPLALPDRMRILERDDEAMRVSVEKLGPLLTGTASFKVRMFTAESCVVTWTENVRVAFVPGVLTKPLSATARVLFRYALRRLPRQT